MTQQHSLERVSSAEALQIQGGLFTPDQDLSSVPWHILIRANVGPMTATSFAVATTGKYSAPIGEVLPDPVGPFFG